MPNRIYVLFLISLVPVFISCKQDPFTTTGSYWTMTPLKAEHYPGKTSNQYASAEDGSVSEHAASSKDYVLIGTSRPASDVVIPEQIAQQTPVFSPPVPPTNMQADSRYGMTPPVNNNRSNVAFVSHDQPYNANNLGVAQTTHQQVSPTPTQPANMDFAPNQVPVAREGQLLTFESTALKSQARPAFAQQDDYSIYSPESFANLTSDVPPKSRPVPPIFKTQTKSNSTSSFINANTTYCSEEHFNKEPFFESKPIYRGAAPGGKSPEYIVDGGDAGNKVTYKQDGLVRGVNPEDTVVTYETSGGQKFVRPSNQVKIFSPRFGSVRIVEGVDLSEKRTYANSANATTNFKSDQVAVAAGNTEQEVVAGFTRAKVQLEKTSGVASNDRVTSTKRADIFLISNSPVSYTAELMQKRLQAKVMPVIAQGKVNAISWSGNQKLMVQVGEQSLQEITSTNKAQFIFALEDQNGKPLKEITLTKVASTDTAQPGDLVEFTLRFENTGKETVQNVRVFDSLTTRLEFLSETAKSSIPASFNAEPNEANSLVLCWELNQPLAPREFGVITFQCRVK
ncbi:MAG: hypothetical protein ACRC2T_08765 [Thermoguttaceae bacterium]